jgi:hypothetical protein
MRRNSQESNEPAKNSAISQIEQNGEFLALACNKLVDQIPDEVWKEIIEIAQFHIREPTEESKYRERNQLIEIQLRNMASVSTKWCQLVCHHVRKNFDRYTPSNWLISKFPAIVDLNLLCNEGGVTDEHLKTMTQLERYI